LSAAEARAKVCTNGEAKRSPLVSHSKKPLALGVLSFFKVYNLLPVLSNFSTPLSYIIEEQDVTGQSHI
jgi:hypothetical protein